jgi:hypothetical protein
MEVRRRCEIVLSPSQKDYEHFNFEFVVCGSLFIGKI